ncbi:MAG: peptidoglycan -binding protein, partial [Tateyamaria sp.]
RDRLAAALAARTAAEADLEAQAADLEALRTQLATAIAAREAAETDAAAAGSSNADVREQLAAALAAKLAAETELQTLGTDTQELRAALAAALAEKANADAALAEQTSAADERAALLAAAREALSEEEAATLAAQRQTELLNQQVAELRTQLGQLQALLDDAVARDAAKEVQLSTLGRDLNTALARAALEERRRRELEEEERKRLEAQAQDLERYRSEFFGRLRDVLGAQEGVRIVGDRFVFSSEVLFPPGGADLSAAGQGEIAKIAGILREIGDDIPPDIDWVIQVDGHTDNIPLSGFGEFADNWELSQARALSVVRYMVNFLGIPPGRLSANGFGQYQPLNSADTVEARAQNRRIELKFTEK